jgi:hypothetical protein
MFCINKNSEEFKELVELVGYHDTIAYYMAQGFTEFSDETSTPGIKPGVEELFDSNQKLANQIYEALGFKKKNEYREIGIKYIIKQYVISLLQDSKFSKIFDDFLAIQRVKLGIENYNKLSKYYDLKEYLDSELIKEINTEVNKFKTYNKSNIKYFSVPETIKDELKKIADIKNIKDVEGLDLIDKVIIKLSDDEIEEILTYTSRSDYYRDTNPPKRRGYYNSEQFQITPEQKQQALQLYSSYLDTVFPDSKVKEMDNNLYISVLNDLKSQKIIDKQCS